MAGRFRYRDRAVACAESGAGAALLLISGLSGRYAFWDRAWPRLAAGFRAISFDHPGCGDSEASEEAPNVERLAALAIALLDRLAVEQAHVVGHSMGGTVAQVLALDYPERVGGLVLSSTWARPDAYFRRAFAQRREILTGLGLDAYIRAQTLAVMPPEKIARAPEEIEAFEVSATRAAAGRDLMLARIDALLAFDRTSELNGIGHRTLVTAYRDDLVVPPHMSRELARRLPAARYHEFPAGGHFGPSFAPGQFCETLERFLKG